MQLSEADSWKPEINELKRLKQVSLDLTTNKTSLGHGRLTARERIDGLLDGGSFEEFGALSGKSEYDGTGRRTGFTPSNSIIGTGKVNGQRAVVVADDFSIRGGSSEAAVSEKWIYAERYAWEFKLPLIRMVESSGGSVKLLDKLGHSKIPGYTFLPSTQLLGDVPVVGIAMGACAGLGALRVGESHCAIMIRGRSQLFVSGPPVVKLAIGLDVDKEDLGGYEAIHRQSGLINIVVNSETEALQAAIKFLSYLPANVWSQPPRVESGDAPCRTEESLNAAIPRSSRKIFDPRKVLSAVFDIDSIFELGRDFGGSVLTVFARLNGYAVGVMIGNPKIAGGALTKSAATKMERFVDLCDTFHLPIVNLIDQPGVMTGPQAERNGTLSAALKAKHAVEQSTTPWLSLVIRRCFGLSGLMISPWHGSSGTSLPNRFAWPSARWASIPVEGGVGAAFKREIAASDNPGARQKELEDHYHRLSDPFRSAERFGVVDIIAPSDTRPLLCSWVSDAYAVAKMNLGRKSRTMR